DDQDRIIGKNVDLYQQQVDFTKKQNKVGLVGPTDVLQAQTLLDSTQSQLIDIRRQRALVEHALAILLGRPPAELSVAFNPLATLPPMIPAGLPADLLRQRPDVAEAEQNLIAANAQVGVAIANFYPVISLTGSAGFESIDLGSVFDWQNRFWSIGPSATFPIFEGGQLQSNLNFAKARYDEVLANYRSTVINAFKDVEDALTNLHHEADSAAAQDKAVKSASEYLRLTQIQYQQGLVTYLQVTDADRTLLTNELTASQLLNQRMASAVLLIRALGGGWHQDLPPSTQPVLRPTTQRLSD
ncbi:MAG: efflux transporter outer membrane subunit, partial [Tepidisphaeraceae bacterium]